MQKNFYHVTNIANYTATTDDPTPISEKYGVFVGNAVFIGTTANTTTYVPTLPG